MLIVQDAGMRPRAGFYASDVAVTTSRLTLLQEARLAQVLTVAWMVVEAAVAIVAGVAARSVALTAFGVDSGVELFSSAVVLHRLLQRSESEERGSLSGGERRASRLVGDALYALIGYIVVTAVLSFSLRIEPQPSPVGIGLTVASL